MRIESVETILAEKWLFVRVTTDSGLCGVGEGGLWAMPSVAEAAMRAIENAVIGRDPLSPADIQQNIYRFAHFRGAALGAALSAIDIALWDIAGQHFGAPVYRLLGGPTRDRIRLYVHLRGSTTQELAASAADAVASGFTAVRLDPFIAGWPQQTLPGMVATAQEKVSAVREAVGPDVDICVECHFKLTPAIAVAVDNALQELRVLFLEDPLPPESPRSTGELALRLRSPVAAGERLHTLEEFDDLLTSGPVAFVRPDLSLVGGFTQARKIAALAEARRVGVVPHNFLSPLSTAICAHFAAAISSDVLLEYLGDDVDGPRAQVLESSVVREGGYLRLSEAPGLGVELNTQGLQSVPPMAFDYASHRRSDGSVIDR
jgi:galactonate dehydratase